MYRDYYAAAFDAFHARLYRIIKQWQGLSLEKYQDKKGIWVIGYGHEITADESFDAPIMLMQAETLLLADINICEAFIHKEMPQIQDRFQQEALIAYGCSAWGLAGLHC